MTNNHPSAIDYLPESKFLSFAGNADIEKIPTLRPAFKEEGTVTVANSSSISDGASALVLMSEESAREKWVKPLTRIVGHATHSRHPAAFTIAPIGGGEATALAVELL